MSKTRTTVTLDERVLRAVRVKAARTGRRDSDVIEEALRRDLGLDLLERVWQSADLGEAESLFLAEIGRLPDALEQVETEIAPERLLDHVTVAPPRPGRLDANGAKHAFIERDRGTRLRHIGIIAS